MDAGQVQAEGFCSFHELAQMRVSAKQVIDELSTKRLLSADQLATGLRVPVRKRRHRIVHHLQHSLGRRPHRLVVAFPNDRRELSPHASSCRKVEVYPSTRGHSCLGRATALEPHCVKLRPPRELAEGGGVGENR